MFNCSRFASAALPLFSIALALSPIPALDWAHAGGPEPADSTSTEALLARSLLSINDNKLDVAMNEVESLLKLQPNFKLAQLVKGDLLLARAQPISNFGNAPGAPQDQMEDLREEARVRLQRFQKQPPVLPPKYLWQLDSRQEHIIVVDTSQSTLYLYKNVNGEARYVSDFYVSIGKLGADKAVEGDQKTPLGVYFINASLPKSKLTDFYGSGAFPLNYPNEWDRKLGRNGYGIWLHGTPGDTYSRPPRASNGCVVLSNNDLDTVGKVLQVGITPVIITNQSDWLGERDEADRNALMQAFDQWRSDWARINTEAYLNHYARDFNSGDADFSDWAQQKRRVNSGKTWIKVNVTGLSIFAYPSQPDMAVVNFEQDYSSNNLSNRMKKRQYWIKRDNQWKIIYEGAA